MLRRITMNTNGRLPWRRCAAFYSVGALGFLLQMGVLFVLAEGMKLHYLVATAAAVEAALLHNFVWHEFWTWADRVACCRDGLLGRLVRFHIANGLISLIGNLVLMRVLVGVLTMNFLAANAIAVAVSSILNFLAGDRLVFQGSMKPFSVWRHVLCAGRQ